MKRLAWVFEPVLAHRGALVAMNLVYLAAIAAGVAITAFEPTLQMTLIQQVGESFSTSLRPVVEAYTQGRLLPAILWTFSVNLFIGSLMAITLPSAVVPFWGVVMGVYRALLWGILFSPLGGIFDLGYLPHVLTGLIEGEAYIVAMLGVWLWWWPVVRSPGQRWQRWMEGLKLQPRIYLVVTLLLAVAAVYEVLEIVYLIPWLTGQV
jgi:hypothetical protein